jgi:hypothetical protein
MTEKMMASEVVPQNPGTVILNFPTDVKAAGATN